MEAFVLMSSVSLVPLLLLMTIGLAGPMSREEDAPVPSDPVFSALQIDGRTVSGRIVAIDPDRITIASAENARDELALRSLVRLARDVRSSPPLEDASHVILPEGDRLMRVTVGSTTDTALEIQSHSAIGKLTIPLEAVLGLVLTPPSEVEAFDPLWERVRGEPRSTDVVWMANGDRLTGALLGLNDHAVKLQVEGKPVEIDRTGVVALGFDPAALSYPRPTSDFLELSLVDGTRLGMTEVRLDKGQLSGVSRFGQRLRFPIDDLVRIDPRTPSVDYLSDRKPDAEQYVSYLGPTRAFRTDRSVDGHRLQLGGRTYERGLGTQSRTLLAYRLKPTDRRFQALVGVDDRAGPLGSVVFRVLVDGKSRLTTPPLSARDTPRPIDVDIAGAKLLILATEFGDRGDVRDHADWVEARIIRQ